MPTTDTKKIPWIPILLLILTVFVFWALPPILGDREVKLEPVKTQTPTTDQP